MVSKYEDQYCNLDLNPEIEWMVTIAKIELPPGDLMPIARTYHSSTIVGEFMFVIGGEADSDLNDLCAFSFKEYQWYQPLLIDGHNFSPKRFHTATAIGNRIATFGGCHSEYIHLNDLNLFDLTDFVSK